MKIRTLYMAMLFISPAGLALSAGENNKNIDLTHVISDYRISLTSLPLDYSLLEKKQRPGVMLQRFNLNSQTWSPQGVVSPERWQNGVDIYIPDSAREKNALVVINNGSNNNGSGTPVAPTNFNEEELSRIAIATRTVVISVSNVPNQVLSYQGVTTPLGEDNSVAYSWKLFIGDTHKYQDASLHIPMAASVSQAFRLAKKELTQQNINKFIVTGASKRGWAAWLTALSDPDVGAVVPFAMDLLNTQKSLEHMYQSYGKNWPVAFYPYYNQGIDQQIGTDKFARLMRLEDPLTYLNTDMGDRLKIDKYIINASGDDFYVPDNSHFYYGLLPGSKSLRVVPNSTHNGILSVAEQSLITFVNRFQEKQKLPEITENVQSRGDGKKELVVNFSEKPVAILQWTARNPAARDFRYACDIKYNSVPVSLATGDNTLSISLTTPDSGWQATYIEATFTDGYVATTQVYITPDEKYPETAPPSIDASCQTLPGRGLSPTPVKQ
ncbi:TPA: PhoPQ-regulated protein [Salmonella enterica subsp. enterica serovar Abortusovis]|uniref:PhoPQ-regulated protein n=4 Tax=Salmonella enterica TaxID=28901 RepID=A0A763XIV8_SALER|nr:PhoPQ-activated protein PqaA family protein [Salmonella enterica]EAC0474228.1 PhoPQ-regulated protein [Salmonella enterica subsp. enterica serovar Tornow]EBG2395660.1 PhoPQ-regulated protein [Salmonella enterica subsp. enterica serovar Everleigh]EBR9811857.1 PhoPQ-regulated protein [Salmonella enterica subsp. enterica serovar Teshie]ECA7543348.1 PhoPQ-regulated protein [Salmonella enterica subsp. enterica serovar Strasbourg]ECB1045394.1 PhoPQ-regulated protein [Salmonella enterica subsp. en